MADIINISALRDYISSQKIRINKTAFKNLSKHIGAFSQTMVKKSKILAIKDKRSTIMPRDITETIEELLGKKKLTLQELSKEITNLGPIDLSSITKAIDHYIEKKQK